MQTYKHTNKDGETKEIPPERWAWGVIYKDGTTLHQFDRDGIFHQIGEIDQDKAKTFIMYETGAKDNRVDIALPDGAKIIHKYRNFIFNFGTAKERKEKIYMFGFKVGNQTHYNYILPDDRIVQSNEDIRLEDYGITS